VTPILTQVQGPRGEVKPLLPAFLYYNTTPREEYKVLVTKLYLAGGRRTYSAWLELENWGSFLRGSLPSFYSAEVLLPLINLGKGLLIRLKRIYNF
jgi:hypothetical protein